VTATDGSSLTRTATFFLQVGSPTALELLGNTTIKAASCSRFQIHSIDSQGDPSSVLAATYLTASGQGSGQFYQDASCATPVKFNSNTQGCPAGIVIPKGDYSPHFAGTGNIWFMDPKAENLNLTISDEANVLKPAVAAITVQ
jgi:hypothetical protein